MLAVTPYPQEWAPEETSHPTTHREEVPRGATPPPPSLATLATQGGLGGRPSNTRATRTPEGPREATLTTEGATPATPQDLATPGSPGDLQPPQEPPLPQAPTPPPHNPTSNTR